jgi:hypothetical protein
MQFCIAAIPQRTNEELHGNNNNNSGDDNGEGAVLPVSKFLRLLPNK